MIKQFLNLLFCVVFCTSVMGQEKIFSTKNGTISFTSEAPLEIISATSRKMEGAVNAQVFSFAFAVSISTFQGFNNGLQQQHFYENYMETDKYPTATYSGKIIEHVDLTIPGTYHLRAKGQLDIHGHTKERILKVEAISTGAEIKIRAEFLVPLIDHLIEVPRIVNQKIAQEIKVVVEATLSLTTKP